MITSLILALFLVVQFPSPQGGGLSPGYWERSPLPQTGVATHYAAGVMDYVVEYRRDLREIPECPECVGSVALLRAGDLGRRVWLVPPGGEMVGPFLVVDCARRTDIDALLSRGWVVDVSFSLAQTWGMYRPMDGVTVIADPSENNIAGVFAAPTGFYVHPSEVVITMPTPTPQFAPATPMPWATRLPVPLVTPVPSVTPVSPEQAQVSPEGGQVSSAVYPPVITTPTPDQPAATQTIAAIEPTAPVEVDSSTTETTALASDVAVGRAGQDLLETPPKLAVDWTPSEPAAPVVVVVATATPYPRHTPLATSALILPPVSDYPTEATPEASTPSSVKRLWRNLLSLILR